MNLTTNQKDAINHIDGHLQLIACAGSGKTEVVARRIAKLLTPGTPSTCLPRNIIAFTFTERAAAELKERVIARCDAMRGHIHGLAEMYIGTIHAFSLDFLKSEAPEYLKFEVLNEVQQLLFVDRFCKESGLTSSRDLKGAPLARYKDTNYYVRALSILREDSVNSSILTTCSVGQGLEKYRNLLEHKRYFDYSSILEIAVDQIQHNKELRKKLRKRIRHVIIDEYQDVNPIQEKLVAAFRDLGADVCVVGDDDQTVYQWRGGDVSNILTFEDRYPDTKQIRLEENFRSSEGVVASARDFIGKNDHERLKKEMKPASAQKYEPGDLVVLQFDDPFTEAEHIVDSIKSLRGVAVSDEGGERGISWSDMAILLRSVKKTAGPITDSLRKAGIPYIVAGMNNLFETAEAEAARQLFYYLAGHQTKSGSATDERKLEAAWVAVGLGVSSVDLANAINAATKARDGIAASAKDVRWSVYNLQRQYLDFIEAAGIREERVLDGRGAVVFYNLGKFSQIISDYESIHFHSKPSEKYPSFAKFLEYGADGAYPEGAQDNQYANPDAVRIMTVHQAKGMQWPVVFVPQMLRNRFPSKKMGGRSVWHLVPKDAIDNQARYEGSVEDERRLFYVAMTRSQKFLHITAGLRDEEHLFKKPSEFLDVVRESKWFMRRKPDYSSRKRLPPIPKTSIENVTLSFSDIKYFFECPYQFKLRILYGFNAPLHEALGYGKSLHDILADVHMRAMEGDVATLSEVPALVEKHLHVPYAYNALRNKLVSSAERVVKKYISDNQNDFKLIEFTEKTVEVNLGDGVSVVGRIDLVRRKDKDETTIVDLKSNDRAQAENITETQLHTYALGYVELTGRRADYVEIYDLDLGKRKPRPVDDAFIDDVKKVVLTAAKALREVSFVPDACKKNCNTCDYKRMCTAGAKITSEVPSTKKEGA
ncbi:MAG: ATP-dependent DNA helicase [Patescibacteria group bacterium]